MAARGRRRACAGAQLRRSCTTTGGGRHGSLLADSGTNETSTGRCSNSEQSSSGPLGDIRSAERWVASLPANDPLVAQRSIVAELHKLAARTARRTPAVLEAVFVVDTHVNGLVRNLTTQYVEHASRSPKIEDQLWHALHELSHGFVECYAAFAREIADPVPRSKWQAVLPLLIARQIVHLGRDAKLRLYRCERWSAAKWTELFTPFTRACALRIEREPLRLDAMGVPTTIERQFLMVLVLKLADPGNLSARQIEWVAGQLEEWCQPLRLTLKPASATSFYVDLAGSTGLQRRSLAPLEGRVLFVDLQPLHALMLQNRVVLEEAVRSEPRDEQEVAAPGPARALRQARESHRSRIPAARPPRREQARERRGGRRRRVRQHRRVRALGHGGCRSSRTTSDRNFGNTMELAVFGRSRTESELRRELGVGTHLRRSRAPGGPWELKDISASGFRLLRR